jgi:hypothetical protein
VFITEQRMSPRAMWSRKRFDASGFGQVRMTHRMFRSAGSIWYLAATLILLDPWRRMYVVLAQGADVPFVGD